MKELVKAIRIGLNLSQEELAEKLGVSFVTISRWENGRSLPNEIAQRSLFEIIPPDLDLTALLLRDEGRESEGTLFHASRSGIEGRIGPRSRRHCDFGKGFYMGTNPLQPLTLVCNEKTPVLYTLKMDDSDLRTLDVGSGLDWAMLIAYYRGYMDEYVGSRLYEKYSHMADGYDVITGFIADDRMYQVLNDFFEKRITDRALIAALSALDLGRQKVAVTEKACDSIEVIGERKLSRLELMILGEISRKRRKEGIEVAERSVIRYRREGRFFDEIMGEDE